MDQSSVIKKLIELEKLSLSGREYLIKKQQKIPTALVCEPFAL